MLKNASTTQTRDPAAAAAAAAAAATAAATLAAAVAAAGGFNATYRAAGVITNRIAALYLLETQGVMRHQGIQSSSTQLRAAAAAAAAAVLLLLRAALRGFLLCVYHTID